MPIVQADRLARIGAALLRAAGASDEEADAVATGCVNARFTQGKNAFSNTRPIASQSM